MAMHSTNYQNTFLTIAEDCPSTKGTPPPQRGDKKSVANYQMEYLYEQSYQYSSDELLFHIHALRQDIPVEEWEEAREVFFSKGQPCLRASPLTKRYGWGIHYNEQGKIALYAVESQAYKDFVADATIKKIPAMRSKRK